jgi:hypothetical protein
MGLRAVGTTTEATMTKPYVRGTNRTGRPWQRVLSRVLADSTVCWLCGHHNADSADHIIPVSKGGAIYDRDNLRPVHHKPCPTCRRSCNIMRGDRDADTFALEFHQQHTGLLTRPGWYHTDRDGPYGTCHMCPHSQAWSGDEPYEPGCLWYEHGPAKGGRGLARPPSRGAPRA